MVTDCEIKIEEPEDFFDVEITPLIEQHINDDNFRDELETSESFTKVSTICS